MWKWDNVGLFGQCCLSGGRHNQDWHGTEMFINICKARTTFCLNITNREHSVPGLCHACPVNSVIMHYWTIIWEIWDCKLKLIKVSIIAGIQLNAPSGQKCWKAKFLVAGEGLQTVMSPLQGEKERLEWLVTTITNGPVRVGSVKGGEARLDKASLLGGESSQARNFEKQNSG